MKYWANSATASKVDYTRLRDLLARKEYKKADEETRSIFLKIAKKDTLSANAIMNLMMPSFGTETRDSALVRFDLFPCIDIRIIDQMWMDYSSGQYGFSIQKRIFDKVSISNFISTVGWRGVISSYVHSSDSYYKITDSSYLNNIQGEKVTRTEPLKTMTWFDEGNLQFLPPCLKQGFYPYKALINLQEKTKEVTIGKTIETLGDLGKQLFNLGLDAFLGAPHFQKEYANFDIKVDILDSVVDYETSLQNFYKRLSTCGIQ